MPGNRTFALREPEGNGVSERFIRTLKQNLLWVRTFDTIEEPKSSSSPLELGSSLGTAIVPRPGASRSMPA
jgi:hypothetical protein